MHLQCIFDLPEGLIMGTYKGIARDLLTFVANFWPGSAVLTAGTGYIALYSKHRPK